MPCPACHTPAATQTGEPGGAEAQATLLSPVPARLRLFWWSLGSGQFDDLDSQAQRIVDDDD